MSNEFNVVGLYDHNAVSYRKVRAAYESGERIVGIVQATGTGKTYNALQLAYDNKDKKIIYVVPSKSIIEHIEAIIRNNPNLDRERDFPNLEFRTYQSFVNNSREEIENIECDLLILDEFHHLGAPVWGNRINTLIETHENMKVFGMTAYTVRDRKTEYERDMANPLGGELFSNKIVSRYDLCDAWIDGVLPLPNYKTAYINLLETEKELEKHVKRLNPFTDEYKVCMKMLESAKRRISEAPSIKDLIKRSIKPSGKYIYFCPPLSEGGVNDIETIKKEAMEWFKEIVLEDDLVIYTTTSEMGNEGIRNREAFYKDKTLDGSDASNKLQIMFAINQYNEGIHPPNVDGVIMGRTTSSDIVYFEQLGRGLSVNGNTIEKYDEYESLSYEELVKLCEEKELLIKEGMSKEELIVRLISPMVIDLSCNYEFIKELEDNLKSRIREARNNKEIHNKRLLNILEVTFDIEVLNKDIYETLRYVKDRIFNSWDMYYNLAKNYFEHYGHLNVPSRFKTLNGVVEDKNGIALGEWIKTQRKNYENLSEERRQLLDTIGFEINIYEYEWQRKYKLAKIYYEHHGILDISVNFKTVNGYEASNRSDAIALGRWINVQRSKYKELSENRKQLLNSIGFEISVRESE